MKLFFGLKRLIINMIFLMIGKIYILRDIYDFVWSFGIFYEMCIVFCLLCLELCFILIILIFLFMKKIFDVFIMLENE